MGCNTSQDQLASSVDIKSDENSNNSKKKNLLDNNENQQFCKNDDLIVEDYGEDEEQAATKIQAAFRGHKTRATMKNSSETSNDNNKPSESSANDPTKEELEAEFDPNDKELCDAALKIQATFRGHLTRKLQGDKPEDKDKIEVDIDEITKKVAEELDIDLSDPELNKAATKIQASFRGHKTRKDNN